MLVVFVFVCCRVCGFVIFCVFVFSVPLGCCVVVCWLSCVFYVLLCVFASVCLCFCVFVCWCVCRFGAFLYLCVNVCVFVLSRVSVRLWVRWYVLCVLVF